MGENYFFKEPSVITENYEIPAVGINNENPLATLDVNGNILASNIEAININCVELLQGKGINAGSNLYINGFSLYNECPNNDEWDEVIPFRGEDGWIDSSWIKRPLGAVDIIKDIIDLGETGLAVASLLASLGAWLAGNTPEAALAAALPAAIAAGAAAGAVGSALKDALEELLDDEGENATESNQVRVAWANVKKKPFATNFNFFGTDRDVYLNNEKYIKLVNSGNFGTDSKDNKILNSTAGAITFMDLGNRKIYANQLHIGNDSNLTINSNNLTFNTPGTLIGNQGICSINSNSLAFGKINGSSVEPSWSVNDLGMFLFKPAQKIYFDNSATIQGSNSIFTFSSNVLAYGSINNSNVVSPIFGIDSTGTLTLHKNAKLLGQDEVFRGSNNYGRLDYSLSNGFKWGLGFTSSNINDIFTINSNGNITTIGNTMTFSNTATIRADLKGTQFLFGQSYDAKGLITLDYNRFGFGQVLVNQQFSNIPSSNFVSPVLSVNRDEGISMYGRPCLLGSNETLILPNPQSPLTSNILLSNYGRLEYSLSNGLTWGAGYSNNILQNNYDIFKVFNDGSVYTLDQNTYTMSRLVNNIGDITKGHTTIKNNGDITTSNLTISGNLFIGDDVRFSRLGMYLFGKKAFDFILQRLFSRYIEFDGIFDNPGFNPNFRQDYPDYFSL